MPVYILYSNIIWACVASAVAGAGAVFLYFFLTNGAAEKRTLEDMKPSAKKDLLIGLRDNAESFADLYEPLYILASGRTEKKDQVFAAWNNAVDEIEGCGEFKVAFKNMFGNVEKWKGKKKKYAANARKLIRFIVKAGVMRDKKTFVTADDKTAEKYILAGGGSIETNVTYDVFSPYWYQTVAVKAEDISEAIAYDAETEEKAAAEEVAAEEFAAEEAVEEEAVEEAAEEAVEEALIGKPSKKEKKAAKKQAKADKKQAKADKKQAAKEAAAVAAAARAAAAKAETEEIIICKGIIR